MLHIKKLRQDVSGKQLFKKKKKNHIYMRSMQAEAISCILAQNNAFGSMERARTIELNTNR